MTRYKLPKGLEIYRWSKSNVEKFLDRKITFPMAREQIGACGQLYISNAERLTTTKDCILDASQVYWLGCDEGFFGQHLIAMVNIPDEDWPIIHIGLNQLIEIKDGIEKS